MPQVEISEETLTELEEFCLSHEFFSHEEAIAYLLKICSNFSREILDSVFGQPFIQGEMPDSVFENEESRRAEAEKKFEES